MSGPHNCYLSVNDNLKPANAAALLSIVSENLEQDTHNYIPASVVEGQIFSQKQSN